MKQFELSLAWRYLRPARREGFVSVITAFSVLGIMLGVATLILVTSLMNGIRSEMTQLFIGIDGAVTLYTPPMPVQRAAELADNLLQNPAIRYAAPKFSAQLMATANGRASGVQLMAMYGDDYSQKPLIAEKIPPLAAEGILLGERLAFQLGVIKGDSIKLISPQGTQTVAGFVPRLKTFKVAGTFKLGMHHYDSSLILMPFEQAQWFLKAPEDLIPTIGQFEIGIPDVQKAASFAQQLQRDVGESARVFDWQRSNASLFAALDVQRNVMIVILLLIVLVAAFNIISSLIMLVQDKRSDIAILRTMGASKGQLMRAFCLSGTLIGLVGTLQGVGLGILAATNLEAIKTSLESLIGQEILVGEIYFLSTLPTQTDAVDVLIIAFCAIVLSFLATLHPARRAASILPAEALRYG